MKSLTNPPRQNSSDRGTGSVVPTYKQVLPPFLAILVLTVAAAAFFGTEWPIGYRAWLLPSDYKSNFHLTFRSPNFMTNWSVATGVLCLVPWISWIVAHPFSRRSPAILTLWVILFIVIGFILLSFLVVLSEATPNRWMAFGLLLFVLGYNLHFVLASLVLLGLSATIANRSYDAAAHSEGQSTRLTHRSMGDN